MDDFFLLIGLVRQGFFYVDVVIPGIFVVCPSLIFLFFVLNVRTCAQVANSPTSPMFVDTILNKIFKGV